ncbi:MAG: DUF2294 domain-containing protein [Spirochaetes bacterium]|nr:DUF2294 domain-containing protein [Spirochaetota bacterium]
MTKGQLEAKISEAIIRFEKEYLGRGPLETKTYIIDDMVLVRLKGILTKAEQQIAQSASIHDGLRLIKRVRRELIETNKEYLYQTIKEITGRDVLSLHTDISTRTGERVIIFILTDSQ